MANKRPIMTNVSNANNSSIQIQSISSLLVPFLDLEAFLDGLDLTLLAGDGRVALRSRSTDLASSPCLVLNAAADGSGTSDVRKDASLSVSNPICAGHLASGCASADESKCRFARCRSTCRHARLWLRRQGLYGAVKLWAFKHVLTGTPTPH